MLFPLPCRSRELGCPAPRLCVPTRLSQFKVQGRCTSDAVPLYRPSAEGGRPSQAAPVQISRVPFCLVRASCTALEQSPQGDHRLCAERLWPDRPRSA
jgi:hypothetical protein